MGLPIRLRGDFIKYFELVYWHEGLDDEKFMSGIEKTETINREIQLCGYFVIVTSDKMTAQEVEIETISTNDCKGWFHACGICVN